jgi:hypothetical protein
VPPEVFKIKIESFIRRYFGCVVIMATTIPEEIVTLDPESIDFSDRETVKTLIIKLLNIIESEAQLIKELQNENQSLKDEINRLKGEKGKPKVSPKTVENEVDIPNQKGEGGGKKNWRKITMST